jgi:hypothetical protein
MDKDQTPQRFPLQRLLHQVIDASGAEITQCRVVRASGYGLHVHGLQEQLDSVDAIDVLVSDLDELTAGVEEWFYDLEVELPGLGIRFGLHDSTALFVEGDRTLVEAVGAAFSNVRAANA